MEIAVTSIVSPGDKVLALNTGYFANRMVEINKPMEYLWKKSVPSSA